jgi:hypothetical protein
MKLPARLLFVVMTAFVVVVMMMGVVVAVLVHERVFLSCRIRGIRGPHCKKALATGVFGSS